MRVIAIDATPKWPLPGPETPFLIPDPNHMPGFPERPDIIRQLHAGLKERPCGWHIFRGISAGGSLGYFEIGRKRSGQIFIRYPSGDWQLGEGDACCISCGNDLDSDIRQINLATGLVSD